jgi:hypothetical protein
MFGDWHFDFAKNARQGQDIILDGNSPVGFHQPMLTAAEKLLSLCSRMYPQKSLMALIFLWGVVAITNAGETAPNFNIDISINSIQVAVSNSETLVEVSLRYHGTKNYVTNRCIKISTFTLRSVIQNGAFTSGDGRTWTLSDPRKMIIRPPPFKDDYIIELFSEKSIVVRLALHALPRLVGKNESNTKYPTELTYRLRGQLSAASCDSSPLPHLSQWPVVGGARNGKRFHWWT